MCPTYSHRSKFNDPKNEVIVTNHNQLVQSVINRQEGRLPILDYNNYEGIIIIDEAHDFEETALSQLSEELRAELLMSCLGELKGDDQKVGLVQLTIFHNYIRHLKSDLETTRGRHQLSSQCHSALAEIQKLLNKEITERAAKKGDDHSLRRKQEGETRLEQAAELISKILDEKNYSHWLTLEDNQSYISIVSVFFRRKVRSIINELTINNKVVFMSGTLAANYSFDSIYYSWGGRPGRSKELVLDTIFDYSKQAIVYVPKKIPKPIPSSSNDFKAYSELLSYEIIELVKITEGRTLILCTSHKQMELLWGMLMPTMKEMGLTFLKQGQKSIELLSKDFKNNETSVLIGSGSFFAGLSVPGKSLVSVILCRLPFPPANDPFIDLIGEGLSESEKAEYITVPRMIIRLLQAGGRLIRTIEDFGCFTILDPRVYDGTKNYSQAVLSELGKIGYSFTRDREVVQAFFNEHFNMPGSARSPEYCRERILIPTELQNADKPRFKGEKSFQEDSLIVFEKMITQNQKNYYEKVRKAAHRSLKLLASFVEPYDMFIHLFEINEEKNLGFNIIEEFPYVTNNQREGFSARLRKKEEFKPKSGIHTEIWTPEQIEAHLKKLEENKPKPYNFYR